MASPTYPLLLELGLNETEALVYELLLREGASEARLLAKPAGVSRENVYHALAHLEEKGLVLAIQGKKTSYQVTDPERLRGLLEQKVQAIKTMESTFQTTLPALSSLFRLSTGRPAIQIFEGLEGAQQALYDSLTSRTEILTYFDVHALQGDLAEMNRTYVKKRVANKIQKRILVADIPKARAFFEQQNTPFTQVAFLSGFPERHASAMELYDGTICYLTLKGKQRVSVLIRDMALYDMHRQQFEYLWGQAGEILTYAAARDASA